MELYLNIFIYLDIYAPLFFPMETKTAYYIILSLSILSTLQPCEAERVKLREWLVQAFLASCHSRVEIWTSCDWLHF